MGTVKPASTISVPTHPIKGIYTALYPRLAPGTCHPTILECVGYSRNIHNTGVQRRPHVIERIFIVYTQPCEAIETPDSSLFHPRRPFHGNLIRWHIGVSCLVGRFTGLKPSSLEKVEYYGGNMVPKRAKIKSPPPRFCIPD
ncbi:MAG: hypothetical protein OXH06_08305 [Gemmatimonadetes bacterium]|nr:hypothetical protein [Gemmatimonadota bacterium]